MDAMHAQARRMATRKRSETACMPCKAKKAKCNDYRPCARCLNSVRDLGQCIDQTGRRKSSQESRSTTSHSANQSSVDPLSELGISVLQILSADATSAPSRDAIAGEQGMSREQITGDIFSVTKGRAISSSLQV